MTDHVHAWQPAVAPDYVCAEAGCGAVARRSRHGGRMRVVARDDIEAEMHKVIPAIKANGGYIFSSDHSVPSSVSLEDFRRIVDLAKELGRYD